MITKEKKIKLKNFNSELLRRRLNVNINTLLNTSAVNPMVRSHSVWALMSEQIYDVLGSEIHRQWFKSIKPMIISENHLILETPNNLSARWIKKNYLNLMQTLIRAQDSNLNISLVSPEDKSI
jgi:hypothetical protein